MFVVNRDTNRQLHAKIEARNALRLETYISETLELVLGAKHGDHPFFTGPFVSSINEIAALNLTTFPGSIRDDFVHIEQSPHEPPHPSDVGRNFNDFIVDCNRRWTKERPLDLAAYIVWRLNWIHPFAEGNGRTARAAAYYAICHRYRSNLHGNKNMMYLLRQRHEADYIRGLRHADISFAQGSVDLAPLSNLLTALLVEQLKS